MIVWNAHRELCLFLVAFCDCVCDSVFSGGTVSQLRRTISETVGAKLVY